MVLQTTARVNKRGSGDDGHRLTPGKGQARMGGSLSWLLREPIRGRGIASAIRKFFFEPDYRIFGKGASTCVTF